MFKNYLKIAARNLLKHKAYSLINVLGLAIGMACCILILLYVQNELSYDRHHENAERIYRVATDIKSGGNNFQLAVAPAPMAETLVKDFPEKVTGVFTDMPVNSHFHFDLIGSLAGSEESKNTLWVNNNFATYILLKAGAEAAALEKKFPAMIEKYMGPTVQQILGISLKEFRTKGNYANYYLQPLLDIHLHSDLGVEFEPNGNIKYVYIFSAIAFFILLIACVNFMNLSTARPANRAKEVGIRKVLGATVSNVAVLMSKDFVKLVLVANLIAWPIGWYAMNRWLQDFAYRIDIGWWVFALAGALALIIALLTVSFQSIKAALANPVESLRYE